MWDGSVKRAKNIIVGDILIDDLGNPTTVRSTCSGMKNMYDVIPDKVVASLLIYPINTYNNTMIITVNNIFLTSIILYT